jgi:type II secretory pathway predicted ATPase ExeA
MLKKPQLRQLLQRIVLRCKTYPLTLEQTRGYIAERLRVAGADNEPIFTPEATELVYRYSRGIPRLINLLCEHALITSFAETQKSVSASAVVGVAHEFELDTVRPVERLGSGSENEYSPAGESLPER